MRLSLGVGAVVIRVPGDELEWMRVKREGENEDPERRPHGVTLGEANRELECGQCST